MQDLFNPLPTSRKEQNPTMHTSNRYNSSALQSHSHNSVPGAMTNNRPVMSSRIVSDTGLGSSLLQRMQSSHSVMGATSNDGPAVLSRNIPATSSSWFSQLHRWQLTYTNPPLTHPPQQQQQVCSRTPIPRRSRELSGSNFSVCPVTTRTTTPPRCDIAPGSSARVHCRALAPSQRAGVRINNDTTFERILGPP